MDGFIKLYKRIESWQWYKDSNTKSLFIDLLLDANYEDSKVGFEIIKRGQCLTSLKRIHERTGLSYRQIRTSLDKLQKSEEIDKQTTNRYSIITIKKYNDYQNIDKQKTNKRQTNDNIKEYKEEQEEQERRNKYIVEIIDYLNMRTGSHYKYNNQNTREHIKARLEEGFTVDDFKEVIDKKCVEWMNTDSQKYLRPDTLFRPSKFESYLNQQVKLTSKNVNLSTETINELFG
ncbi:MAG: conserved phage C-terminal domain-containing protein [Bacilli bacterium]|nr:conserved phage C-terminal domain-containing protein [Bacilli bacterium]